MTHQADVARLRTRIILLAIVGILVTGVVVALVTVIPYARDLRQNQQVALLYDHRTRELLLRAQVERFLSLAEQTASQARLREALADYNRGALTRTRLADEGETRLSGALHVPEVAGIYEFDAAGRYAFGVGVLVPPKSLPAPDPGAKLPILHEPFRDGAQTYVIVEAPVRTPQGAYLGATMVLFESQGLMAAVKQEGPLGTPVEAQLVMAQGEALYPVFEPGATLHEGVSADAVRAALAAGGSGLLHPSQVGHGHIVAYGTVQGTPWGLLVVSSTSELYAQVGQRLALSVGATVILLLIGGAGVAYLLRPLSGRILVHTGELESEVARRTAAAEAAYAERLRVQDALEELARKQELILRSAGQGIMGVDGEGHVTFANPAACQLLGWDEQLLVGQPCHSLTHLAGPDGSLYPETECPIQAAYADGAVHAGIGRMLRHSDGVSFHAEYTSTPIREGDALVGAVVVFDDVTARLRTEEALRASERALQENLRFLRTLIDTMPVPLFYKDVDSIYRDCNDAFARQVLGSTREEIIGSDLGAFHNDTPTDLAAVYRQRDQTLLSDRGVQAYDAEVPCSDGTLRHFSIHKAALEDEEGRPTGIIGVMLDVTERLHWEAAQRRHAEELERANSELRDFTYIVSHDLRAPLVNLKGFAAELRMSLDDLAGLLRAGDAAEGNALEPRAATIIERDVPESLEFIEAAVGRMDGLINALLQLSRLGRRELDIEEVDVNALLQETLRSLAHVIENGAVEVRVGDLPRARADRTAFGQVLGNILDNAIKYLRPGVPGRIEVDGWRDDGRVVYRIRDNGRGIATEDMPKVFAPFRRAGAQDVPGEGMGLAYVQALLRRHGGKIACESQIGEGTTFTFDLPSEPQTGGAHA